MHITFETPDQPQVHALIAQLDAYLYSLYPPENVYALDLASLLSPNVHFAVARDAAGVPVGCAAIVLNRVMARSNACMCGPMPAARDWRGV